MKLYEAQDEVDDKKDALLTEVEQLLAIKDDYDKVTEGNLIALEIGISTILERCPRFRSWIEEIINRCKE